MVAGIPPVDALVISQRCARRRLGLAFEFWIDGFQYGWKWVIDGHVLTAFGDIEVEGDGHQVTDFEVVGGVGGSVGHDLGIFP